MVICKECGKELKIINNTHLLFNCKNKLTMEEYRIKHNLSFEEIINPEVIKFRKNTFDNRTEEQKQKTEEKTKQTVLNKQKIHLKDLTNEEKQILIGGLFGDSYIRGGNYLKDSAELIMEHGIRQLDYLLWKGNKLKRLGCKFFQSYSFSKVNNRYAAFNKVISKASYSGCLIGELGKKFYTGNSKKIDKNILYQLDPLGIAIWYMDDGSYGNYYMDFCTQSFSLEDNILIQNFFKEKFNINTNILESYGKNKNIKQYFIRIIDRQKLINLIEPFIHFKLRYKIGEEKLPECIISKKFYFDAAHFLENYNGKCTNLHGGRWEIWVQIKDIINPETGMVIDFVYLKNVINHFLIDSLDHNLLNSISSELRWRSTTEILCMYFWNVLIKFLPNLYKIELYETPDSKCEFQGPSLKEFKFNKENKMVKLLDSFGLKDVTKKSRFNIDFDNIFNKEV